MERNTIEDSLNQRIGSTSLESHQTGGLSNEELWSKIKNEIPTRKIINFDFKKKMIVGVALSLSLAGVAMYSGFTYYEYQQSIKTKATITPIKKQEPSEFKEEVVEISKAIEEDKVQKTANAQIAPIISEQPSKEILTADVDPDIPTDTLPKDTVSTSKAEIVESTNTNLQSKADTVVKEKKTIYMKPAPVQVQAKKVKYVKKKKSSKK